MISCRRLVEFLADVVDGSLPAEQGELVREHLAACPQCLAFADSYRAVIRLARRLPPLVPPRKPGRPGPPPVIRAPFLGTFPRVWPPRHQFPARP